MLALVLLGIAGVASARPLSARQLTGFSALLHPSCSEITTVVSVFRAQPDATAFCSQYLRISPTTVVRPTGTTQPVTTSTAVVPATATSTTVSPATITQTSTTVAGTVTTYLTTVTATSTTTIVSPLARRGAPTPPSCFAGLATSLLSSIPTPTSTVLSGISTLATRTSVVQSTSTTTTVATSTLFTTTVPVVTSSPTSTIPTQTIPATATASPLGNFQITGVNPYGGPTAPGSQVYYDATTNGYYLGTAQGDTFTFNNPRLQDITVNRPVGGNFNSNGAVGDYGYPLNCALGSPTSAGQHVDCSEYGDGNYNVFCVDGNNKLQIVTSGCPSGFFEVSLNAVQNYAVSS